MLYVSPETSTVRFIDQVPWGGRGDQDIADIVGVPRTEVLYVGQDSALPIPVASQDSGPRTFASEGFSRCTAVILPALFSFAGNHDFAHVQGANTPAGLMKTVAQEHQEAILIKGRPQNAPTRIEPYISQLGMCSSVISLDTGQEPFGVVWNVDTGTVSVVRRDPDRTIFRFQL